MFDLDRFVAAQERSWEAALAEIRRGRKESHWMWWIFPQLRILGFSPTAKRYGIEDLAEAKAYLAHPVLGPRLVEAARAILLHRGRTAGSVLGEVDGKKLRSCATLFAAVPGADSAFQEVLDTFYEGKADTRTLEAL